MKIGMCTWYFGDEYKKKHELGIESKRIYCKKHNIDFILEDETADYFDNTRSPEWYKLLQLKKYINNYDYLFWSDADVLIKNMDYSLYDYLNNIDDKYILIIPYCPNYYINSGHFFIKNTPNSIDILNLFYNQTQFINVITPEQVAITHVLQNNINIRNITYLEYKGRLLNAFTTYHWSKTLMEHDLYYKDGDFLIHYAGLNSDITSKCMLIDYNNNYNTRELYNKIHDNLPLFYYNNLPLINKTNINKLITNNLNILKKYLNNKSIDLNINNDIFNLYWIGTLNNNRWNNISYIGINNFIEPLLILYEKKSLININFTFLNQQIYLDEIQQKNNEDIKNIFNNIIFKNDNLNNYEKYFNYFGIIFLNNNNSIDNDIFNIFFKINKLLIPQGILICNINNQIINKYINMYIKLFNYKELNILQNSNYRIIQKNYK